MRRFIIRTFIFLTPFFSLVIVATCILWISKEDFYKLDEIIKSSKVEYLIGYAYNDDDYRYLKWAYLKLNDRKCVWALGSSRVLEFRENMFDSSFYNEGFTVSSLSDFRSFLESIPKSKYPKYIILGLDQWMFNVSADDLESRRPKEYWGKCFSFFPHPITYWAVYKDLFAGKYKFRALLQDDKYIVKVGINAKVNNVGYRNDGSYYYGNQRFTAGDYKFLESFEEIRNCSHPFEYGNSVNVKALIELDKLLRYCKENRIQIVAFLPPFADEVYKRMSESGNYAYLKEIYIKVKPLFDKYRYEIYDFSIIWSYNSSDLEMVDGIHSGELACQRILINMLERGSILNRVANVERLRNELSNAKDNFIIYDNRKDERTNRSL